MTPILTGHRRRGRATTLRQSEVSSLVILGAPRSGTSLLYKALCLHPEAAYISNWLRSLPGLPDLALAHRAVAALPRLRRQLWFGPEDNAYAYERRRPWPERLFPAPVEGEPIFRRAGLQGDDDEKAWDGTPKFDLDRWARRVVRASGAAVFITKRIAHNRRVSALQHTLPLPRFVVLQRDGRGVAASLASVDWWPGTRVWWAGITPEAWAADGRDPWELCGRHWVEEVRSIDHSVRVLDPSTLLRITYEELVRNPVDVLAEVASFGGLGNSARWRDELVALRYHPGDAWRTRLDPGARATIERVQHEELATRGYW